MAKTIRSIGKSIKKNTKLARLFGINYSYYSNCLELIIARDGECLTRLLNGPLLPTKYLITSKIIIVMKKKKKNTRHWKTNTIIVLFESLKVNDMIISTENDPCRWILKTVGYEPLGQEEKR